VGDDLVVDSGAVRIGRRLAGAALVALVLLAVVYVVPVLTEAGQRRDDVAYAGSETVSEAARARSDRNLGRISQASLALLGGSIVLVGLSRGRWRLAVAAGVVIGGTVASAEILKALLPRPELLDIEILPGNSWPSGHVAIAASVSLAFIMVVPRRGRLIAAALGAAFVVSFGVGVVVSGWHRPSDALSACLLALVWACSMSWILVRRRGVGSGDGSGHRFSGRTLLVAGSLLLAAGFVGFAALVLVDRGHEIGAVETHDALIVAIVIVAAAGLITIGAFTALLRDVSLDAPASGADRAS
jgi:membrane-associated phospholipid phosphatase